MTTWTEFSEQAPETAAVFERRHHKTGLALLATTRADGFPRISPFEPLVTGGRLWIGSMGGSRKSADLRRDPRCCVHSATEDKQVADGDAKLWGRAVEVVDAAERRVYVAAVNEHTGNDLDQIESGFDLWWLDLTEASSVQLGEGGDHLRITVWKAGSPERTVERR